MDATLPERKRTACNPVGHDGVLVVLGWIVTILVFGPQWTDDRYRGMGRMLLDVVELLVHAVHAFVAFFFAIFCFIITIMVHGATATVWVVTIVVTFVFDSVELMTVVFFILVSVVMAVRVNILLISVSFMMPLFVRESTPRNDESFDRLLQGGHQIGDHSFSQTTRQNRDDTKILHQTVLYPSSIQHGQ